MSYDHGNVSSAAITDHKRLIFKLPVIEKILRLAAPCDRRGEG
jgi:hypothetical protein